MMLYGRNLRDIIDFKLARQTLQEIKKSSSISNSKFELIKQLQAHLQLAQSRHDLNYKKYVIIMKKYFDQGKSHVTHDTFEIGDLVAYYVGDRAATTAKFHRRFTGPWRITNRLRHNTVTIKNEDNGESFSCHTSMLKKYFAHKFTPLVEYELSQSGKDSLKDNDSI